MKRSFVGGHFLKIVGVINLGYVKQDKFLHNRSTGDVVSRATGSHFGKVNDVYVDKWGDGKILGGSRHLAQHSIDNMVEAMKGMPWTHTDLGWKISPVHES
ncbi:MAG: hypothetical protein L0Z73_16075 [Gammaproteobacteria bacterium]|nr:hypothetical protein [Gammaproteobacteria bacterium]